MLEGLTRQVNFRQECDGTMSYKVMQCSPLSSHFALEVRLELD